MKPNVRTFAAAIAVTLAVLATVLILRSPGADRTVAIGPVTVPDPHRDPGFAPAERAALLRAVEAESQDAPHAELAAQGREIFRSSSAALAGESCQSCHTEGGSNTGANPGGSTLGLGTIPHSANPSDAGAIGQPQIGFNGLRNAPALYGVGETDPFGWDGKITTLEGFTLNAVANHFNPVAPSVLAHDVAALVAYMETIEAPSTDFDRGTLTPAAIHGQEVFQNQGGCIGCHSGPNLTDGLVHDIGVPQPPGATDFGVEPRADAFQCGSTQSNLTANPASPSACFFNTPGLRGALGTAPYFHNGIAKTLRQVVNFYNGEDACTGNPDPALTSVSTIAPLGLTCADELDLIEYLKSL